MQACGCCGAHGWSGGSQRRGGYQDTQPAPAVTSRLLATSSGRPGACLTSTDYLHLMGPFALNTEYSLQTFVELYFKAWVIRAMHPNLT